MYYTIISTTPYSPQSQMFAANAIDLYFLLDNDNAERNSMNDRKVEQNQHSCQECKCIHCYDDT